MNSGDGAVLPTMETVTRSRWPWWLLHGAASPQYVCVSDLSGLEPFTRRG
jgi:hypothetical protein